MTVLPSAVGDEAGWVEDDELQPVPVSAKQTSATDDADATRLVVRSMGIPQIDLDRAVAVSGRAIGDHIRFWDIGERPRVLVRWTKQSTPTR